jgi:hypothetical protein
MAVNDKISQADYNSVRTKLVNVIGTGSANYGWGQPIYSSAVAEGSRVTVNEWANLGYDVVNAYKHIFGTNPTLASPAEGNSIRYSTTFTPATTDSPVTQFDTYANTIVTNRFTVHSTQSFTTNKGSVSHTWPSQTLGTQWTSKIKCIVSISFTNATQARYFFNSGGLIRFASTQAGGSGYTQNTSWRNLLSAVGAASFGGGTAGVNFYQCTDVFGVWYTLSASNPYSANSFRISARTPSVANNSTGTASTVEFLVEWADDHVGIAGGPDRVDGTFTLSLSTLTASGVLVPVDAGAFVAETPSVTINPITL